MDNILEILRQFDAIRDGDLGRDFIVQKSLPAISPSYSDESTFDVLSNELIAGLKRRGIDQFYQHQAEAIRAALKGANIVLQAPTASGKTLAFQVPMLQSLIEKPHTYGLMIYPNKALALDQRDQLSRLTDMLPGRGRKIESWWYDGDTDREQRTLLRKSPPSILITNPDMLHNSFLGHSDQWQKFYQGLEWVIVDEIHEYRGYFGSNVAMILRRFVHHLAEKNIHPQFFLCSATCANAREHAENLTGLEFQEVNASNSMQPRRYFTFVQPDIPDYRYWEILQLRTVKAGLACLIHGKSVLAFCPTRKFAEECHLIAMREIEKLKEEGNYLIDPEKIKVFRSGLSIDERHGVQEGLKNGTVRLVFTTNALELGIDIGGLDGVILAGFPDSMMSAWQRIGRAGRNWNSDAFVLYYARNNPLDRFYASNLETFLNKPFDDLVINPGNEDIIEKHLPSLLFETSSIKDDSIEILGPVLYDSVIKKKESGAQPVKSGKWRPHSAVNIRGGVSGSFILKEGSQEIGTLSGQQQFREAYQRAIYMHGGRTYRVKEISLTGNGGEINLGSAEPYLRTNPAIFTTVTEQDIYDARKWILNGAVVSAFFGKVLITEALNSIEEVDERTGEVQDRWKPGTNSAKFDNAHAFWVQDETPSNIAAMGITALQQLLRVGALFSIPLDAHDIFPHAVAKDQKAYIVESYPGGIGIARKAFERWRNILNVGIDVAENCKCSKGCPNCIVPPRFNEELDKNAGVSLARIILSKTEQSHNFKFVNGLWEAI